MMKRNQFVGAALAFALVFALTGCSGNQNTASTRTAPDGQTVTLGPNGQAVRTTDMSRARGSHNYYATDTGRVVGSGTDQQRGTSVAQNAKNAADDAGDAVRNTLDKAGDAVRDTANDAARGAKDIANDMTGR